MRGVLLLALMAFAVCAGAISLTLALPPTGDAVVILTINREGDTNVYAKDPTNAITHRLTYAGTFNGTEQVSPDGDWIAFISNRSGNTDIYLMDRYGGSVRNLSDHPERDHSPYWTGDSQIVYFTSNRTGRSEWWVVDLRGDNPQRLADTDIPPIESTRACRSNGAGGSWSTCARSDTHRGSGESLP